MTTITPTDPNEFAEAYATAYAEGQKIRLRGGGSKWRFAGPVRHADTLLETKALTGIREYDPRDLTISVGAGMPFAKLAEVLGQNGQMLPIDPPFHDEATIGGVVASGLCGPRRRGYGTARDFVIGVEFADHQGRLVQSGAMVAKNVAGYDLNKLFVGGWGTLGPMVSVNLRVSPIEKHTATFLIQGRTEHQYHEIRDRLLRGFVQPVAIDYVNANAGERLRLNGSALIVRYANAPAVIERLQAVLDLPGPVEKDFEPFLWMRLREWLPTETRGHSDAVVLQLSTSHSKVFHAVSSIGGRVLARAASGVIYAVHQTSDEALATLRHLEAQGCQVLVLSASDEARESQSLWAGEQSGLGLMKILKAHFDPQALVNGGRFYGCF